MPYNFQILGTVIASVLEYDHLIRITGDPAVVNPAVSSWVPADGRPITGSALERAGVASAPDLRGRFLRGLNTFFNNGQPALVLATADPDDPASNRTAGQFQGDQIKKHAHPFSHVIQVAPNEPHSAGGGFKHDAGGSEGYNNYSSVDENTDGGTETRPKNIGVYYYIKIN